MIGISERKKKNETDELYNALNSYHQNIKLTLKLIQPISKIQLLFEVTAKLQFKCTIKLKCSLYTGHHKSR